MHIKSVTWPNERTMQCMANGVWYRVKYQNFLETMKVPVIYKRYNLLGFIPLWFKVYGTYIVLVLNEGDVLMQTKAERTVWYNKALKDYLRDRQSIEY